MTSSFQSQRSTPRLVSISFFLCCAAGLAPTDCASQTIMDRISSGIGGSGYGLDVEALGDYNGDAVADFAVISPGAEPVGSPYGQVQFISGANFSVLRNFVGTSTDPLPGYSLAVIGDLNNDGVVDFALGSPTFNDQGRARGAVIVYNGATGAVLDELFGTDDDDSFGFEVTALGDINGDNIGDFAVGAPTYTEPFRPNQGYVRVFSGFDRSILTTIKGDGANDRFGYSIARLGDLNADGTPDFVVGAPEFGSSYTGRGFVRAISGANFVTIFTKAGALVGSRYGSAVANAGDVNGDGRSDIVVGAPNFDDAKGKGYVISGNSGTDVYEFLGKNKGDWFAAVVKGVGDVTGDGRADYAMASLNGTFDSVKDGGYIRIFSGIDGSSYKILRGRTANGFFGASLLGVGDLDGSGTQDLLVGAPLTPSNSNYDANPDGVVFYISLVSGALNPPAGGITSGKKKRTGNKKRKGQRL